MKRTTRKKHRKKSPPKFERLSDDDIADIYSDFKRYVEHNLLSDDNPRMTLEPYDSDRHVGHEALTMKLVNLGEVDLTELMRTIKEFQADATCKIESTVTGALELAVHVPVTRLIKRKRSNSKRRNNRRDGRMYVAHTVTARSPAFGNVYPYKWLVVLLMSFAAMLVTWTVFY